MNIHTNLVEKTTKRIKQERERKGITKEDVASILDYGINVYTSYETKTLPSLVRAVELALFFGCSVDYLLGLSDVRDPRAAAADGNAEQIIAEYLERYRNAIPRKAFIEAVQKWSGGEL